ncbi:MAG: SpoIID/LytB domain-containing protein [Cyanobacteria bacterium P01_A01_bin.135]
MTASRCPNRASLQVRLQQMLFQLMIPRLLRQTKWSLMLAATLLGGAVAQAEPAQAELEMRVAIEEKAPSVVLGSSTQAVLLDGDGDAIAQIPAGGAVVAEAENREVSIHTWQDDAFWIQPQGDGYVYIGDSWYRGRTQVVATAEGLTAVNHVDLEDYLYSVVASEMPTSWPAAALQAQAVAARSYALHQRQHRGNVVFDVGDTTSWQVYKGIAQEAPSVISAVDATAGQVLTHNGRIIEAVFHSSSGGHTENVENVWSSAIPYLRGVADFDQAAPVFRWTKQVSAADVRAKISGVGNVISMTPERLTPTGRIASMQIVGDAGRRSMKGSELRSLLGLRSTLFEVQPQLGQLASAGNLIAAPTSFTFVGRGYGHGVGMSQWGARGMADQGYGYDSILGHYYQGVSLAVIDVQ